MCILLAVLLAALFGVGALVSPERAKGLRDKAVRATDRLVRDDPCETGKKAAGVATGRLNGND